MTAIRAAPASTGTTARATGDRSWGMRTCSLCRALLFIAPRGPVVVCEPAAHAERELVGCVQRHGIGSRPREAAVPRRRGQAWARRARPRCEDHHAGAA